MNEDKEQSFPDTQVLPDSDVKAESRRQSIAAEFDKASQPGDLWPEAADALCSEPAALFASTQPGSLGIV